MVHNTYLIETVDVVAESIDHILRLLNIEEKDINQVSRIEERRSPQVCLSF